MSVAATGRADVTDDGVWLDRAEDGPLVLALDGRYVWSFTVVRDGRAHRGGVLVPWPPVLRRFLVGRVVVRVGDVGGSRVLLEEEVVLGGPTDPEQRVRVEDARGRPLAVDKVGHLCRAFEATDETIRDEIVRGTRRALDDLRAHAGVEAYLCYGALLGAVRDGAMIAHDSDTDVCYVSHGASPADVVLESYRVERVLRSLGWRVLRMSGGDVKLLLPLSDGRVCHVDVFVAFRVGETFFQLGNRSGRLPESAVLPTSTVTLHGVELPAPADPEAMLAFVYGPGWRVPDPAFRYADPPAGVRRLDGWLRGFRTRMPAWTEVWSGPEGRRVPRRRSEFARWVHLQLPPGAAVADLGCGSGRDSIWFAARGRRVRAVDFSRAGRRLVRRRARRRGLDVTVELVALDDLRAVLSLGAELARDPHHVHARQLLGCLDRPARDNLWRLCRMAGGSTFLELSATAPGAADPGPPGGLVRRLDPALVRAEITAAGGVVEHEEDGPGTDLFDQPDPRVVRLRVSWPRRSERTTR
ncbi:methyltransferase domain-containing protein [Nocardioides sp. SYSU D00038]|uniref:class I SAM-dependent methyltransferase n=1 Tax=Nocardioides sp. SYSU D00038 TaxID=2812554 RepID=UPI0027DC8C76|nr:methyltransferase domain-containing protein [Nocardioides sp. SYSU D00038]